MKKVAFTLCLAFFAAGLFAQSSASKSANSSAAPVSTLQKQNAQPVAAAKPAPHNAAVKPAAAAQKSSAKPAAASFKAKPGTEGKAVTPATKKHRHHKAKSVKPATSGSTKQ